MFWMDDYGILITIFNVVCCNMVRNIVWIFYYSFCIGSSIMLFKFQAKSYQQINPLGEYGLLSRSFFFLCWKKGNSNLTSYSIKVHYSRKMSFIVKNCVANLYRKVLGTNENLCTKSAPGDVITHHFNRNIFNFWRHTTKLLDFNF